MVSLQPSGTPPTIHRAIMARTDELPDPFSCIPVGLSGDPGIDTKLLGPDSVEPSVDLGAMAEVIRVAFSGSTVIDGGQEAGA